MTETIQKTPVKMRSFLPVLGLAVILLIIGRIIYETPHIKTIWLSGSDQGWKAGEFTCPQGKYFAFVLGFPQGQSPDAETGTGKVVVLSNGRTVAEFPFDTQTSTKASWLDRHQLQGYVLNWPTNRTPIRFEDQLIPGANYQVTIDPVPSSKSASLWLVFTQTQRDKRKR